MHRYLFVILMLLLGSMTAQAQQPASWEAKALLIYSDGQSNLTGVGEVVTITPEGITERISIPDGLIPPDSYGGWTVLSPDGRFIVRTNSMPDSTTQLVIADLQNGTCCTTVDAPGETWGYSLGTFDPTSQFLAYSFVQPGPGEGGYPPNGGIRIADVTTGQIVNEISTSEFAGIPNADFASWALMGQWTDEGIEFAPNCYACEGIYQGQYSLWKPDTNEIIPQAGTYFGMNGDFLRATGEMITAIYDERWPTMPPMGMLPPFNVAAYYANGGIPVIESLNEPIFYLDTGFFDLGRLLWVDDGRSVLNSPYSEERNFTVIGRDGTVSTVPNTNMLTPLIGTPDGFLAIESGYDIPLNVYHWVAGTSAVTPIAELGENVSIEILTPPELGTSLGDSPQQFSLLTPPGRAEFEQLWQSAEFTCSESLPSRLLRGYYGRVTPGAPNNIRNVPFPSEEEPIGQIPAGAEFYVDSGPFCDGEGRIWWYVNYDGIQGYTVEANTTEYWAEPVDS